MDYETVLEELLEEFHKAISALDGVIAKAKELPGIDEPVMIFSTTNSWEIKLLEDQIIVANVTIQRRRRLLTQALERSKINERFNGSTKASATTAKD